MGKAKDTAILAVSFGTSYHSSGEPAMKAIEEAVRGRFPMYPVRRAYTSRWIIEILKRRDGICIDSEEEALLQAQKDGIRRLIVQPTHLMSGLEYHKLKTQVEKHQHLFESVALGKPLLSEQEDFEKIAEAMAKDVKPLTDERTAAVFMGHGTEAKANQVYSKLQKEMRKQGYDRCYIAAVEAEPKLSDILPALKKSGCGKVVLQPLMIVAGDHAANDMAGDDEDSWKSMLEREGFSVRCVLKGMGQIQEVREVFLRHIQKAAESLEFPRQISSK